MEHLEWIVSLASACLGLAVTVATLIAKFVKSAKAKKAAEQTVEICNAILPYVEQAEKFVHYSGEEKKAYVMASIGRYAVEHGISLDEVEADRRIEELVQLSKTVNVDRAARVLTIPTDAARCK